MKTLINYHDFVIIKEAEERLESFLNSIYEHTVNESSIGAVIKDPIKFTKIKNNAKKYQQALVQKALNNVDYEKKKQAAGGEVSKEKAETLKAANAAKNQALSDKATAIADRMNTLATTPVLQSVKSLAISKSKVAAAETSLKAADAEETKQLKVKIQKLQQKSAETEATLKDYVKDETEMEKNNETPKQQSTPEVKDNDKNKSADTKNPAQQSTETSAQKKEREAKEKISKSIENAMKAIERAKSDKTVAEEEKSNLNAKLKDVKGTTDEGAIAKEVANADKAIKDIDKSISDLQGNIKDLRKQLEEFKK